jgi:serine/threonine protein kinase
VAIPAPWASVETLKCLEFSSKSDVWSLGVTFWEMFSLGALPYAGMTWNDEFILLLENGLRLSKPIFATNELYVHPFPEKLQVSVKCFV